MFLLQKFTLSLAFEVLLLTIGRLVLVLGGEISHLVKFEPFISLKNYINSNNIIDQTHGYDEVGEIDHFVGADEMLVILYLIKRVTRSPT